MAASRAATTAARLVLLAAILLVLTGCPPTHTRPDLLPDPIARTGPLPTYDEIVERYNANLAGLDQLWSTSVVAVRWTDEDGDRQFEQGEGNFIYGGPQRVALTVGKLGNTILWAGSNEQRYWLFDLRDRGVGHVGAHANVGRPCTRQLPVPVSSANVPHLLGLLPLATGEGEVGTVRGYLAVRPAELNVRMLLHPQTYLPVRVDLLDERGESVVIVRLSEHEPVEMQGRPRAAGARVATRTEFYVLQEDAQLSLRLNNMVGGERVEKVNPRAFDFDALLRAYSPAEVIDLDEDCP